MSAPTDTAGRLRMLARQLRTPGLDAREAARIAVALEGEAAHLDRILGAYDPLADELAASLLDTSPAALGFGGAR
jgi:hypothetical protein